MTSILDTSTIIKYGSTQCMSQRTWVKNESLWLDPVRYPMWNLHHWDSLSSGRSKLQRLEGRTCCKIIPGFRPQVKTVKSKASLGSCTEFSQATFATFATFATLLRTCYILLRYFAFEDMEEQTCLALSNWFIDLKVTRVHLRQCRLTPNPLLCPHFKKEQASC